MMPNVAFVSFFIIALYFFIMIIKAGKGRYKLKRLIPYLFFGIFLALSLMIRTSEIVWIGLIFLILAIINYKKINFKFLILSFIIFLIVFSPIFIYNQQIYGSPLSLGYALEMDLQNKDIFEQSLTVLEKIFLPFGFHPRLALKNLYNYTFIIFPLWSILIVIGFLIFITRLLVTSYWLPVTKKQRKIGFFYIILFLITAAYLTIYYGSWPFHDNLDPNAVTIGTSYIRYWLPLYLFSLPFLGYSLVVIFKKFKVGYPLIVILLIIVLGFQSYRVVMESPEEGIYKVKRNINEYQYIASNVIENTENNSIIIADRMDKVFFPIRRVIFRLNVNQDYVRIKELIKADYPIYYFYFTRTESELNEFSRKYFEPHGLKVEKSILDFDKQSLYPVQVIR